MVRNKREIIENPIYTEVFFLVMRETKGIVSFKDVKEGISTLEIKNSIEEIQKLTGINKIKRGSTAFSNRIVRMKKEGIILESGEKFTKKKIRYIINKEWVLNKIFEIANGNYKYIPYKKERYKYDPDRFEYFLEKVWSDFNYQGGEIYRWILYLKEYESIVPSKGGVELYSSITKITLLELFEHLIIKYAFDMLDERRRNSNNYFLQSFKITCLKHLKKKLQIKDMLYPWNNVMGEICDAVWFDNKIVGNSRKELNKIRIKLGSEQI